MLLFSSRRRNSCKRVQKVDENRYFGGESEKATCKVHRCCGCKTGYLGSRDAFRRHLPVDVDPRTRNDSSNGPGPMRVRGGGWHHYGYFLFLIWLMPGAFACIHLLDNQWKPKTLGERTEKAKIVASVYTRQTFKETRTPDGNTYSAEFQILKVLKGGELLKTLAARVDGEEGPVTPPPDSPLNTPPNYNISNFGDKSMCYSDVSDDEEYILFLTTFEGRLSASYIDIFSAAAELTPENEQLVLEATGWKPWTHWTACSRTCNHGVQTRKRKCRYEDPSPDQCEGRNTEERNCNIFSCKRVVDLLELLQLSRLPEGVSAAESRKGAFHIDATSSLTIPTKDIFKGPFPTDFSVIAVLKPSEGNNGFILTISDLHGFVKIGIQVGENPAFVVEEDPLSGGSVRYETVSFPVDLSDGEWHNLAYAVQGQEVSFYLDCSKPYRRLITRPRASPIATSTVTSLGKTFVERNSYPRFIGDVELLLISDDPSTAEQQCYSTSTSSTDILPNHGAFHTSQPPTVKPTASTLSEVRWSAWSSCSVTCGRGLRARVSYCPQGQSCEATAGAVQTRQCRAKACPHKCRTVCYNGGVCETRRRCSCPLGYYGRQCEIVSCHPPCFNGGACIEPNKCSCLPGYTGIQCEQAHCNPECRNGGRCLRPGVCVCPYGYLPPDCRPACGVQCYNGGTCVGYNYCRCLPGYSGNLCQNAVCDNGCGNGGKCIAPNTCQCASGYTGKDCRTPICVPPCLNGGTCFFPFYCICPHGTFGSYCQHFLCTPRCLNGGTCIGLNTCTCPREYSGQYCQTENCAFRCLNGGICTGKDRCQCPHGYHGNQCQSKICLPERSNEPYQKVLRKLDNTKVTYSCGLWGWSICTRKKTIYRLVYKTFYRSVYRCI